MKHFALYELVDKATFEKEGQAAWLHFDTNTLIALDDLREFFGVPITVNNWHAGGSFQFRGYRPPDCTVGAKGSYHRQGMAFDCDVEGYSAEAARHMIIATAQVDRLIARILRIEGGVNWLHFDLGAIPAGHERIYVFKA